jgi:hypothetical protein
VDVQARDTTGCARRRRRRRRVADHRPLVTVTKCSSGPEKAAEAEAVGQPGRRAGRRLLSRDAIATGGFG